LPFCLFTRLIYGFRARIVSLRPRAAVLIAAILCSIASFATLAWIVPASNDAGRVAALRNLVIQRGLSELTVGELRSLLEGNRRHDGDQMQRPINYHTRLALGAAPIVLTGWAFLLLGRLSDRGRWLLGIVAIASCVAYVLLMVTGRVASSVHRERGSVNGCDTPYRFPRILSRLIGPAPAAAKYSQRKQ
jgi:hypothetical protein